MFRAFARSVASGGGAAVCASSSARCLAVAVRKPASSRADPGPAASVLLAPVSWRDGLAGGVGGEQATTDGVVEDLA